MNRSASYIDLISDLFCDALNPHDWRSELVHLCNQSYGTELSVQSAGLDSWAADPLAAWFDCIEAERLWRRYEWTPQSWTFGIVEGDLNGEHGCLVDAYFGTARDKNERDEKAASPTESCWRTPFFQQTFLVVHEITLRTDSAMPECLILLGGWSALLRDCLGTVSREMFHKRLIFSCLSGGDILTMDHTGRILSV